MATATKAVAVEAVVPTHIQLVEVRVGALAQHDWSTIVSASVIRKVANSALREAVMQYEDEVVSMPRNEWTKIVRACRRNSMYAVAGERLQLALRGARSVRRPIASL